MSEYQIIKARLKKPILLTLGNLTIGLGLYIR